MYNVMKHIVSLFVALFLACGSLFAGSPVLEKLKQIPQISEIQELKINNFNEYYQFYFEQPLDHADPSKGTFKQRVLLGHKEMDAPVIVELEGYYIFSPEAVRWAPRESDRMSGNRTETPAPPAAPQTTM